MKKKIAIVSQRYGEEVIGGAEGLARELAEHMRDSWDIEVITTCAKDYRSWKNEYPEGKADVNGIPVLRFPVAHERNFAEYSKKAFYTESRAFCITAEEELQHFQDQGPYCPKLVDYLEASYDKYDAFIFMTYLYYPTAFGIPKVAKKAYLISTAHDEPPFYFIRTYAPLFHSLKGIIYLTPEEKDLINRVYQIPSHIKQIYGGYGVAGAATLTETEKKEFTWKYRDILGVPYFVYCGRASNTKRCGDLFRAYAYMTWDYKIPSKLLMIGMCDIELPENRTDVINIGFLSEKEKSFLLGQAQALVNPSALESLSMVMLEAWMHETPVIINGESPVMRGNCDRSGGGLYYFSVPMLKALMAWVVKNPKEARVLGARGKKYTEGLFNWRRVRKILLENID